MHYQLKLLDQPVKKIEIILQFVDITAGMIGIYL